jgi:hypothetical protein
MSSIWLDRKDHDHQNALTSGAEGILAYDHDRLKIVCAYQGMRTLNPKLSVATGW